MHVFIMVSLHQSASFLKVWLLTVQAMKEGVDAIHTEVPYSGNPGCRDLMFYSGRLRKGLVLIFG